MANEKVLELFIPINKQLNQKLLSFVVTIKNELRGDLNRNNSFIMNNNVSNNPVALPFDRTVSIISPSFLFLAGVIGNLLALMVLIGKREQKMRVFYFFVTALVITDMIGIVTTSPLVFASYLNRFRWVGGTASCYYFSFMMVFAGQTTVFLIGAMAVERFISVKYPFFHATTMTTSRTKSIIIIIWLISFIFGILPVFGCGQYVIQYPGTWCFFEFVSKNLEDKIYALIYSCSGLLTIVLTIAFNCGVITNLTLFVAKKEASNDSRIINRNKRRAENQMVFLLIGITIVFTTCWSPLMIRVIINQMEFWPENRVADLFTIRLASINQTLDPWIYILFRREFFTKILSYIRRLKSKKLPPNTSWRNRSVSTLSTTLTRLLQRNSKDFTATNNKPLDIMII